MPATPAIRFLAHCDVDAEPFRLLEETYLLVNHCRASVSCGIQERRVDIAGAAFLRVAADKRLTYNLSAAVPVLNGLADYAPGRDLSDRALDFFNGADMRHQFAGDGIFIYDSAEDDDSQGDLRSVNMVIDYDLHSGTDVATYPNTGTATTYTDIPAQADHVEVNDTARNYVLQDIFYGEDNIGAGAFYVDTYNGDPAGAGTLVATATCTDVWTSMHLVTSLGHSSMQAYAAAPATAILFNSSGSSRTVTYLRLRRGSIVLCDKALDASLTVPANTMLRLPADAVKVLCFCWQMGAATPTSAETPAYWMSQYCCGGTSFTHFPENSLDIELYAEDPDSVTAVPVDVFRVGRSSSNWTVSGVTVAPATTLASTNTITDATDILAVIVRPSLMNGIAIKNYSATGVDSISAGGVWSNATYPSLDMDDTSSSI